MWDVLVDYFFECSFVGKSVGYFVSSNSCVCSHFVYMNSVWGPINFAYNSRY